MKLSDLSIKRPVLAVVMSLLLIVLGTMSFLRLTLRELPAIDPPIVSVQVDYPGASAGVVETRITKPLEDALAGIEGIETIQARSSNGRSNISIEFGAGRDIEAAARKRADHLDLCRLLRAWRQAGPDVEGLSGRRKGEGGRRGDQQGEAREEGGHLKQTSRSGRGNGQAF